MTAGKPRTQHDVEQFLFREARLLDEHRYQEWFELFTRDAVYWLPMGEGSNPMVEPSVIYDDYTALARRVYRLVHTRPFAQRPVSETTHVIGNVELGETEDGQMVVRSSQVVYETRPGNPRQYGLNELRTLPGRCEHRLVLAPVGFKISYKRFTFLGRDAPTTSLAFIA